MLKKGTRVKIMIPLSEATVSKTLKKLNGTETEVTEWRYYKVKNRGTTFYTYSLKGCVGKNNKPYEFCAEWLIPLDEEVMI